MGDAISEYNIILLICSVPKHGVRLSGTSSPDYELGFTEAYCPLNVLLHILPSAHILNSHSLIRIGENDFNLTLGNSARSPFRGITGKNNSLPYQLTAVI